MGLKVTAESNGASSLPAPVPHKGSGQVVLYRTEDGRIRIQVTLAGDSAWLSLNQIADLFQRDKSVISKHIKKIFDEGESDPSRTVAKLATVQTEGPRSVARGIEFYRLEVIVAVGYAIRMLVSRTIRQAEVMSMDRSHCLRTCFWYSSGSKRLLLRIPAAAFQLLGIRGRGCQTPRPFRISTGMVVPIAFSFPQFSPNSAPSAALR